MWFAESGFEFEDGSFFCVCGDIEQSWLDFVFSEREGVKGFCSVDGVLRIGL